MNQKLCVGLAAILFGLGGWTAFARAAEAKRPNIVLFLTDDQASASISAYGDSRKLLETPNIDRVAKEGMLFKRCMVPNSLCGPCRATIITGKYSHMNGFYHNTPPELFDPAQQTVVKLLHDAGYQTGLFGKWHLYSKPQGFDRILEMPPPTDYYNPVLINDGVKTKYDGYVTDILTDQSIAWMKKLDRSKPFLLLCWTRAPHRDWEPPLKYLGHDHDRKYPEPETLRDDYSGRGKAEREQDMMIARTMRDDDLALKPHPELTPEQLKVWNAYYEPRNKAFWQAHLKGDDLLRWKYNRFLHDYTACIKSVDDSVGKMLQFLDDEHLADNTMFVYASDQGAYLGEHGWFDKRWIFEESLKTPMLVRWPGKTKPGSVNNDIVSNVDYAETFLEAAGLKVPADMQGRSLVPVLEGKTPADWRKSFYYHYYEYPAFHDVARHYGVVTDRYKLIHFYQPEFGYWELFDLQKDPHEMKSVYDDPSYAATRKELETELARLRKELKVPETDPLASRIDPRIQKSGSRKYIFGDTIYTDYHDDRDD